MHIFYYFFIDYFAATDCSMIDLFQVWNSSLLWKLYLSEKLLHKNWSDILKYVVIAFIMLLFSLEYSVFEDLLWL